MKHNPIMGDDGHFHDLDCVETYWKEHPDEVEEWTQGCECELDWSCPIHAHQPTSEDRIATYWSENHP